MNIIMSQLSLAFLLTLLFSSIGFSQTPGCIFLEGLELSCFGSGASCQCGDYFTETEIDEACKGTLSPAVPGCNNTCGTACCDTHCSTWIPSEHGVCEKCTDCKTITPGTIPLSCDEPEVVHAGRNLCGTFTYGCGADHGIECQGTGVIQGDPDGKCLIYPVTSAPANRCGQRVVGAIPNACNGSPTGAPECGGFPNRCTNTSSSNVCLGSSNECWTCSFMPGIPGTSEDYCGTSSRSCVSGPPIEMDVVRTKCGYVCPRGSIPKEDPPPHGDCGEIVSQCSENSDCP